MDQHRQVRREPAASFCQLPTTDIGQTSNRARSSRLRPLPRLPSFPLVSRPAAWHGLAQAHVVGQAVPSPTWSRNASQESALLVRAQRAGSDGETPSRAQLGLAGEQIAQPAVRVHLVKQQHAGGVAARSESAPASAGRRRAGLTSLKEAQRPSQVLVVEFHPLPAVPGQTGPSPSPAQRAAPRRTPLVADRQVVAEEDQVTQAELRLIC